MKLLWAFSTFGIGGPQRRAAALIRQMGDGFDHTIIAMDGVYAAQSFLPDRGWRFETLDFKKSRIISLRNLDVIRSTLRRLTPDLLLTSNWGSFEWSVANRGSKAVPQIHFEDGFGPDETPDRQIPRRAIARMALLRRRTVVVPSRTLERVAISVWKLTKENVIFVPNGVDARAFQAARKRQARRGVIVGSLGALRLEKDYPLLVRSVARARESTGLDIRLRIQGEGTERAAIEAAACGADWVELPGATDDPAGALSAFDIFALSSRTEQAPLSLIEAMAAGLPIASTSVGDIASMVSRPNAPYITKPGDMDALAAAIASLASDQKLRDEIGLANARRAETEYSLDAMCSAYRSLFSRVAAAKTSPV